MKSIYKVFLLAGLGLALVACSNDGQRFNHTDFRVGDTVCVRMHTYGVEDLSFFAPMVDAVNNRNGTALDAMLEKRQIFFVRDGEPMVIREFADGGKMRVSLSPYLDDNRQLSSSSLHGFILWIEQGAAIGKYEDGSAALDSLAVDDWTVDEALEVLRR